MLLKLFLIKQFTLKLSLLDFGPKTPFDPTEVAGGVERKRSLGGDAWQEGEVAPGGKHRHLGLQKGEPHPNASTGTLAKGLEGVSVKGGELEDQKDY